MKALWPGVFGAACALGSTLPGQHVLEAGTPFGPQVVVAARGATPHILNAQGKPAAAPNRLTLRRLPYYAEEAAVVEVTDASLEETALPSPHESFGRAVRYHAELTASRAIRSCYVVVWVEKIPAETDAPRNSFPPLEAAVHAQDSSRREPKNHRSILAVHELPDLVAGEKTRVDLVVPLPRATGTAPGMVLLFSGQNELLTANLGSEQIEAERLKTRKHALKEVKERPPTAFLRVAPRLPRDLRKRGVSAEALVRCRIDAEGNVVAATLATATHAGFGEAAHKAVLGWKFLPAIEDHQFVERSIEVPFHFQSAAPVSPPPRDSNRN